MEHLKQGKKIAVAILISGRGSNMLALMKAVEKNRIPANIKLVISDNENAQGLRKAQEYDIRTLVIEQREKANFEQILLQELDQDNIEILCCAGFMKILTARFLQQYQRQNRYIINIHPSLLPQFKGLEAVAQALSAGVAKTGATVHHVSEHIDSGEIILQRSVNIEKNDDEKKLADRILQVEHQIYPLVLKKLCLNILKNKNQTTQTMIKDKTDNKIIPKNAMQH